MKRKTCVYVSGTVRPPSPPSHLTPLPLFHAPPARHETAPLLRVGFVPPNLGAQTGDAERRAKGGTPPPLVPCPRLRANGGPSVTPRQRTAHRVRTQHPPLPCASPLCHLGATRRGCSNSAARSPLPFRPVVAALTAASPFASYGATRERRRFRGPDGGEAEWRGPPPLSRERGRAPISTRAGRVPPPSARGVHVTPPRRPSGGPTAARERYTLPSLWLLPQ